MKLSTDFQMKASERHSEQRFSGFQNLIRKIKFWIYFSFEPSATGSENYYI